MATYEVTVVGTTQPTEVTYTISDGDAWEGWEVANKSDASDLAYALAVEDPRFANHIDLEVTYTEALND